MRIGKFVKIHEDVPRPVRAIPVKDWPVRKVEQPIPVEIPEREKVEVR